MRKGNSRRARVAKWPWTIMDYKRARKFNLKSSLEQPASKFWFSALDLKLDRLISVQFVNDRLYEQQVDSFALCTPSRQKTT